jgi:hypothetical protein
MPESSRFAPDLAAILRAGELQVDDESIAMLDAALKRLRALYPMAALSLDAPAPGHFKAKLDAVVEATSAIARILDDDFEAGAWLEATLAGAGAEVTTAVRNWLRRVPIAAREIYLMIEQDSHPRPRRREEPETWCICALHDLFGVLGAPGGGADAKSQQFVAAAVKYLALPIKVPTGDSYRLRLRKALNRRSSPVNLLPLIIKRPP